MHYIDLQPYLSNYRYSVEEVTHVYTIMEEWCNSNIEPRDNWTWSPWSYVSYINFPVGIYFTDSEDAVWFRMTFGV